jgi:hypothetical protein
LENKLGKKSGKQNWEKKYKKMKKKKNWKKEYMEIQDTYVFVSVTYCTFPKYIILRVRCIVLLGKYAYV